MNPTFQHSGEHPARLHKLSKCARAYLDGLVGGAMPAAIPTLTVRPVAGR